MARIRSLLVTSTLLLTMAAGGYLYYRAEAGQADGELAQAPLNNTVTVKPALIFAMDDSGSMNTQLLTKALQGLAFYKNEGPNGFFNGTRLTTRSDAGGNTYTFLYVIPHISTLQTYANSLPPIDMAGFARSAEYNRSYFNPNVQYKRWRRPDGKGGYVDYPQADPAAASLDPDRPANGTINLTALHKSNDYREHFFFDLGMKIAAGTEYYLAKGTYGSMTKCGGLQVQEPGVVSWSKIGADGHTMNERCMIGIAYLPATYYSKSATAVGGYSANKIVEVANGCGAGCSMYRYRIEPGNYANTADYQRAINNFANWFVYYRDRNLAARGALGLALEGINDMRVGLFNINGAKEFHIDGNKQPTSVSYPDVTMRDFSDPVAKMNFYSNEIANVVTPAKGATPNKWAVNHIGEQFMRRNKPGQTDAPILASCQKNIGMLVTDGMATDNGPANIGNADGNMPAPLSDAYSNTMADIVAKYYVGPLRTDLAQNRVPIPEEACKANPDDPKLDCNRQLHMNFHAVSIGVEGDIYGKTYDPVANRPDPYVTAPAWVNPIPDTGSSLDDLWHATMNGRGRYLDAASPTELTAAMASVIGTIGQAAAVPVGSFAMSGARIGSESLAVQTQYESANNGSDWFSRLHATRFVNGSWVAAWEASGLLAAPSRNIKFARPNAGRVKPTLVDFTFQGVGELNVNLDATTQTILCDPEDPLQNCAGKFGRFTEVTVSEAIHYLRGDRRLEGLVATRLRKRTTLLGDIINSTPLVTGANDDYGYAALDGDKLDYSGYLKLKRESKRKPFVYVGANDGMFHAFDGTDGREAFAYIPATSIGHMGNLLFPYDPKLGTDQVFKHRYYVDGPITAQDAHWGSSWKTVVVATVGAGGRGVFALDVTDQGKLDVLWELNDRLSDTHGAKDIGSVLGQPVIVPVKDSVGKVAWKAIFGNGYGSANGQAVLFVVDIATGDVARITARETAGPLPTRTKNGLGNVVAVDRYVGTSDDKASDGYADTVYSGDLNGAVWKFDLRSNKVALEGKPLFVARYKDDYTRRQPITGGFEATLAGADMMIFFGTGSYSFSEDAKDQSMQTMYGVLDRDKPVEGRSQLLQQFIYQQESGLEDQRMITTMRPSLNQAGWYLDLGLDASRSGNPIELGERFVGNPRMWNGKLLFPAYEPTSTDGCGSVAANWLYAIHAVTGGASMLDGKVEQSGNVLGGNVGAIRNRDGKNGSAPGATDDVVMQLTGKNQEIVAAGTQPGAGDERCYAAARGSDLPTVWWVRPCGRQSWRQLR